VSRLVAWAAFLLGAGASVAANVAHARPELGPRLVAAFAPLALVLAVELAVRVQWRPGAWWTIGRWGGTGLVAVVTAVVSYRHQTALLAGYGEDPVSAAILPLSVDGLMITAAAALLALGGLKAGPAAVQPAGGGTDAVVTSTSEDGGRADESEHTPQPVNTQVSDGTEPSGEHATEPAMRRPARRPQRPDDELLPLLRLVHATEPLTRRKVQTLTDVSTRQADRLLAALKASDVEIQSVNGTQVPTP
jgi:hypothetical protein